MFNATTEELSVMEAMDYARFNEISCCAPEISETFTGSHDFYLPFSHTDMGEYYSEGYGVVYED